MNDSTIIIGGGIAGLTCALTLHKAGQPVLVLEASPKVGGRVRTDPVTNEHGTFLCDMGFQVYLDAYPEGQTLLDLDALDLKAFYPGSLVRTEGALHRVADPFRKPLDATSMFTSPIASITDKVRLGVLDQRLKSGSLDDVWTRPETTTMDRLKADGFGERAINRFFRPFFGGVFFDTELRTSSRMFEFVYRMMATGNTTLPAQGMGAIPLQMSASLSSESIRTNERVRSIGRENDAWAVRTDSGNLHAANVVVATDAGAAATLVPSAERTRSNEWQSCISLWFDAPAEDALLKKASQGGQSVLLLDGEGMGPASHACVPSISSPSYAPEGRALVTATVVTGSKPTTDAADDESLARAVREQLHGWFDGEVDTNAWNTLRVDRIDRALPRRMGDERGLDPASIGPSIAPGLWRCGDHLENNSINGAMASGRRAAEALLGS